MTLISVAVPIAAAVLYAHGSAGRTLDGSHFLGYNVVNLASGNFSDPGYAANTAAVGGTVLRYPGGNLADWWDWRTGWCVSATSAAGCPECHNACKGKPRRYYLTEFRSALRRADASAVLMVSMLTSDLDEQLAYLAHAQDIGVLVAGTYVELGGEFYWGQFSGRWPRATDYSAEANTWADAIKQRFPSVRVMAVAAHSTAWAGAHPTERGPSWNSELYASVNANVDGVTMHPYLHLGDDRAGGGPLQPGVPPRAAGEGPSGWASNASVQRRIVDEVLRSDAGMELLLGVPFYLGGVASGDAATGRATLPSRLRLIVTEYNMMERAGPIKLSWAHALFMAAGALTLLGVPQVDAALLHVLLNGWGWGGLYDTSNDFQLGGVPPPLRGDRRRQRRLSHTRVQRAQYDRVRADRRRVRRSAPWRSRCVAPRAEPLAFDGAPTRRGARPGGLPGTVELPVAARLSLLRRCRHRAQRHRTQPRPVPLRANVRARARPRSSRPTRAAPWPRGRQMSGPCDRRCGRAMRRAWSCRRTR